MTLAGNLGGGHDTCRGDSGGPLILDSVFLVGIVSWGEGCARPNRLDVYARISVLYDWIRKTIRSFNDDP